MNQVWGTYGAWSYIQVQSAMAWINLLSGKGTITMCRIYETRLGKKIYLNGRGITLYLYTGVIKQINQ